VVDEKAKLNGFSRIGVKRYSAKADLFFILFIHELKLVAIELIKITNIIVATY
jgi:hypothetical protein